MMHIIHGNVLDMKGVIIHGVNCMGVMGAGVALQVKERWPNTFTTYRNHCMRARCYDDLLGTILVDEVAEDQLLVHAFTQKSYGKLAYASYDAIDSCFEKLNNHLALGKWQNVFFPMIGCGYGKLHWTAVQAIIEHRVPDNYDKFLVMPFDKPVTYKR